jgi:hypothetical protein
MTQVRSGVEVTEGGPPSSARTIRRRSGLPSGRAVVGGFLVARPGETFVIPPPPGPGPSRD